MTKIAIFSSGISTDLENIINRKDIKAEISLFVCDKTECACIDIAKENNIPVFTFEPQNYERKKWYEIEIINEIEMRSIDLIILAGYRRKLSKDFIDKYKNRIINVHTSLLPLYRRDTAIQDAYDDGKNIYGVTVYYVSQDIYESEIIIQESLLDTEGQSFSEIKERIHNLAMELYPMAIKSILEY